MINLLVGKQFFVSKDARIDCEARNDSHNTHNFGCNMRNFSHGWFLDMVLAACYVYGAKGDLRSPLTWKNFNV